MFRFVLCLMLVLCCDSAFSAAPVISDYNTPDDALMAVSYSPTSTFGSGVWESFGEPAGWQIEIVSQPEGGYVEFYPAFGWNWQYTITTAQDGDIEELIVRLRNGDEVSNCASVFLFIAGM